MYLEPLKKDLWALWTKGAIDKHLHTLDFEAEEIDGSNSRSEALNRFCPNWNPNPNSSDSLSLSIYIYAYILRVR